tara:strand:+ start:458 stop:643 length:186 start_codon:yes stop_codon:yes gene_type:complete
MSDETLQQAIDKTHSMVKNSGQETDSRRILFKHLERLLDTQEKRAMVCMATEEFDKENGIR